MFQDFINNWIGKSYDGDGAYSAQCVDWSNYFIKDFGGLEPTRMRISGGAKDYFLDFPNSGVRSDWGCDKIPNGVNNFPLAGDIVVWGSQMGGGYGHVAIADSECTDRTLRVIEQNGGRGSGSGQGSDAIRRQTYSNYNNVLGWVRVPDIYLKVNVRPTPQPSVTEPNNNIPMSTKLKDSLIQAFQSQNFDTSTREHLINAVHGEDGGYIAVFAGSDPRRRADELQLSVNSLNRQNEVNQNEMDEQKIQEDKLKYDLSLEVARSESKDNQIINLESEVKKYEEKVTELGNQINQITAENVINNPSKEKFSFNKFFVGLSKNGAFIGLIGTAIGYLTLFLSKYDPAIAQFAQELILGVFSVAGVSIVGQNLQVATKSK